MNPTRTDKHPGQGTMWQVVYAFPKSEYSYKKASNIATEAIKAEFMHHVWHRDCEQADGYAPHAVIAPNTCSNMSDVSCDEEHWIFAWWYTVKKRQPPKGQKDKMMSKKPEPARPNGSPPATYHVFRFRKSHYTLAEAKVAAMGAAIAHCEDIAIFGEDWKYYKVVWGPSLTPPPDYPNELSPRQNKTADYAEPPKQGYLGGDVWAVMVYYCLIERHDDEAVVARRYWREFFPNKDMR